MVNGQSLLDINKLDFGNMLRMRMISKHSKMQRINKYCWASLFGSNDHPGSFLQEQLIQPNVVRAFSSISNPNNLPHYPVPKLDDTLKKYLQSVKPLLTDSTYEKSRKIIEEFGLPNGEGTQLQNLLKSKAERTENWLSEWWLNGAYLGYRLPVVVHSNPGLCFPTQKFKSNFEWIQYTARIICAALNFKQLVEQNAITPEKVGNHLLDMGQYKKIFGTCRIPAENVDKILYNPNERHIVIAYQNGFFKLPIYHGSSNDLLNEDELVEQLYSIIENHRNDVNSPVGILTTEHRDILAKAYNNLIQVTKNLTTVECIQKALFIVCLDKKVPFNHLNELDIASQQLIHGGGLDNNSANRWFDKTIQFIVNENGFSGLNYEHSPAEGQPIAKLADFILKQLSKSELVHSNSKRNSNSLQPPCKIPFEISNKLEKDLQIASENLDKLSGNLDMKVVHYKGYGKNFIKSQKLSPDSFIQMAMQYAFYKYHGEPGAHYETAQQRIFIHGRTETIRSCSVESLEFAKTMCRKTATDLEKVQRLREAVKSHKDYTVMAMAGGGVDRHLFGMKQIALENNIDIPALYMDAAFKKSTHYRISTSQVNSSYGIFMCFGPVVEDGYGICYNPRQDDMYFAISAFHSVLSTSAEAMGFMLKEALEEMYSVLCNAGQTLESKL